MIIAFFLLTFFLICFYSFFLVDPSLTFINHPLWEKIRSFFINFGYYRRFESVVVYVILLLLLFNFYFLMKDKKNMNIFKIALIIASISLFSYPFLSRDFFNYLFDAKIFTFYGKNPYFHKPSDFLSDPWLRFMHWTHRTYPYGPVFLILTFIPSFFSFGKFVLAFLFFKIFWGIFYLLAVYFLEKLDKKIAFVFAFHPLILVEGLINNHNDLIGLSLAIIGIYFLLKNKNIFAYVFLIFSFGIKYISFPLLFLKKKNKNFNFLPLILIIFLLFYLSFFSEIQPWYFLILFAFLPFFPKIIDNLNIFLLGLLLSYYPYLRFDFWNQKESLVLKHKIIIGFLFLNFIFYFLKLIILAKKIIFSKK